GHTGVEAIARAKAAGGVLGCKLYPAGATTHSAAGVTDVRRLDAVFERMAETGLVLQVHGEVTDPAVDIFEREPRFIDTVLAPLAERHRHLRIVFEHITRGQRSSSCWARAKASPPPSHRSTC